jgi:hypothetical protein
MPMQQQLDLFAGAGTTIAPPLRPSTGRAPVAEGLDDQALIAAIPEAVVADSAALAAEAGRRRLTLAVPALEALCRRFAGFGADRLVPEQAAALCALAAIGGRGAAQTLARMIARGVLQGPALIRAISVAAQLRATLPEDVLRSLLRHPNSGIRADACCCARRSPELISVLIDLLGDLNRSVARSAACALGQMGRVEAQPTLGRLLREEPSEDVIDASSSIADEECIVTLGRIARSASTLSVAALEALEGIDQPRAVAIAAAIRRAPPP